MGQGEYMQGTGESLQPKAETEKSSSEARGITKRDSAESPLGEVGGILRNRHSRRSNMKRRPVVSYDKGFYFMPRILFK